MLSVVYFYILLSVLLVSLFKLYLVTSRGTENFCFLCCLSHGLLVHPVLLFAHNGKISYFAVLMSPLKWETFQKIVKIQYLHFFYFLLTS